MLSQIWCRPYRSTMRSTVRTPTPFFVFPWSNASTPPPAASITPQEGVKLRNISGQKQRVAISGALAEACKVLLLDELTTFLDESDQMGVIKAVEDLIIAKKGDVTALWVTHRLEELEYADGAVYMENRRVVRHGDAATISEFIKVKQSSYIDQIGS